MNKLLRDVLERPFKPATHPITQDTMLKYFISQLSVRSRFLETLIVDVNQKARLASVTSDLDVFIAKYEALPTYRENDAWNEAYRLERMLALIEPADSLIGEIRRRLDEADDEAVGSATRLRTRFDAFVPDVLDTAQSPPALKPGAEARLRSILLDILEDMHWTFQKKFYSRPIQKSATKRIAWSGLAACCLFILPFIFIYIVSWRYGTNYRLPLEGWAWLPLWTSLTAGFFGAMFSRLLYLVTNWNIMSLGAVKDARDFASIFLRGAVGMTGAVVVYYFLLSGVIGGGLFPNFQQIGLHQVLFKESNAGVDVVPLRLILPNAQLALLVVWSFLAGFSERLVPSILQSTETSLRESGADRKTAP